ncbi:MAG: SH3 domain-containing protein [Thermoanaerobaculia bacterium]
MDDQLRRMLEQYQSMHGLASSASEAIRQAHVQASAYDDLNLVAQAREALLGYSTLTNQFSSAYRYDALAQVDEMLEKVRLATPSPYQISSGIAGDLVNRERLLVANQLTGLNLPSLQDSYSQLAELQKIVAAQSAWNDLSPLLSAQLQWARTAQIPSSLEQMSLFGTDAMALVRQISELSSNLLLLPSDLEEIDDEEAGQAIALANERLADAFFEKTPARTLGQIQELLKAIKSGAIALAPGATKVLLAILISVIGNFIYDTAKSYVAANVLKTPHHVEKAVNQAVKQLQSSGVTFPLDMRVVVAPELLVRRGPSQSTPVVGRLYAADIVWLLETRSRSWTLVEFHDNEGEVVLRGWVFSRYIRSLKGGGRSLPYKKRQAKLPPGAGAFDSGHTDTAERSEELLGELGFGEDGL